MSVGDQAPAAPHRATPVSGSAVWQTVDWWFMHVSVFVVAVSLIGLLTTLVGCFHAPQVLIAAILVVALYAYITRNRQHAVPGRAPRWWHILLILLVALAFRVPAYHYVMGGQDEGVYVNIAHYIERTGGIEVHDRVRQSLRGTPYLKQYDAVNKAGSSYLPGVYKDGGKTSKLQFQFYDVFPVWIALFIGVFGTWAGVYALTFLALFSLALFYRLALLLTNNFRAALAAGGLLALSPLHAFFSKFPVTAVPTLCFALIGFLLLAAYSSSAPRERRKSWLVVSVAAFLCVFTTRISGFMYVPFMIGLAWVALLFDQDVQRRVSLQFWTVGVVVAYLVSVAYGLVWSSHYANDIYRLSFAPLLGPRWETALIVLALCVFAIWGATVATRRYYTLGDAVRNRGLSVLRWIPSVVVYAALCIGVLKIYWLGWTSHYAHTGGAIGRWGLSGIGWHAVGATSLWTLVVFMGPLLVPAFLAMMPIVGRGPRALYLAWFVAGLFAYAMLLQWLLPYSPYYARYLLSALVPYMILVIVLVWSRLRSGRAELALSCVLVASLLYGGLLSAAQIGKNENHGARSALARIIAPVGPHDLILLDGSQGSKISQSAVKTPLIYTFNRAVVTVDGQDLEDRRYMAKLRSGFDHVYLLTSKDSMPARYKYVRSARFRVMAFQHDHLFPRRLVAVSNYPLNLYRQTQVAIPVGFLVPFSDGATGTDWLHAGWSRPEAWGTWSVGNRAVLSIDPRAIPSSAGEVTLRLRARAFVTSKHPVQHVSVSVGGITVGTYVVRYPAHDFMMDIPVRTSDSAPHRPIRIVFMLPDATSPAGLGVSRDGRQLGIGLVNATFLSTGATKPPDIKHSSGAH